MLRGRVLMIALIFLVPLTNLSSENEITERGREGRDGRRGGHRGISGRTPSMSRSQRGMHEARGSRREAEVRSRPRQNREQVRRNFQSRLDGRRGDRREQRFDRNAFTERRRGHRERARNVRRRMREDRFRRHHRRWFDDDFFWRHHRPFYHRHGDFWWRRARWSTLVPWLGWGYWVPPIYYDSQYSIIIPQDVEIYQEAPVYQESPVYREPTQTAEQEWLPIGVFAAGRTEEHAAYSNMFVQLAVNRQGDIAGTYYNATTDQAYTIAGMVDKETQTVIWTLTDDPSSPTMTTGLYNLTQEIVEVRVTFPNGTEQSWVLINITDDDDNQ